MRELNTLSFDWSDMFTVFSLLYAVSVVLSAYTSLYTEALVFYWHWCDRRGRTGPEAMLGVLVRSAHIALILCTHTHTDTHAN